MYTIVSRQIIADKIKRIDIHAPLVARKAEAGQFVMVTADALSERIPVSIFESDKRKGTIAIVIEEAGRTTERLGNMMIGSRLYSLLGPLGTPSEIKEYGTVVCVGYGASVAELLPACRALRAAGNKVISIVGARTRRALPFESQMRLVSGKLLIATDDGSYEHHGSVVGLFDRILQDEKVNYVYTVCPVEITEMMVQMTLNRKIKTRIRLTPASIDGMGMTGGCRVMVEGRRASCCLAGPDFNGHQVDLRDFLNRTKGRRSHALKASAGLKESSSATFKRLFGSILEQQ